MGSWIGLIFLVLCATAIERHGLRRGLIRAVASVLAATGLFLGTLPPALAEQVQNRGAILAAGYGNHSCALLADGRVQCWGENRSGQLGDGTTSSKSAVPVPVGGLTNAMAVTSGGLHSCAVLADGRVQCWGENRSGQLGDGTTSSKSAVPVPVRGLTNAVAVASGWDHTCALLAEGRVQCWGANGAGQLGNGTTVRSAVPVTVSGITNAMAVAGGLGYTCAVLADGRVQCWGTVPLGNGTTSKSAVPVTVSGITNAVAVAGGSHTCAVLADGRVQCWGFGGKGNLGNGTTTDSGVPVTVSGLTSAVAVAASGCGYSCAVLADGRVQCWGHNHGENGTKAFSSVPMTISGITNAVAIATGDGDTCAALADGRVQCWGAGPLGNGTISRSAVPVSVSGITNAAVVASRATKQ